MLTVLSVKEAREKILASVNAAMPKETVDLPQALGRVLYGAVTAQDDLPAFARSTVDGYAVRAEDTYGATESMPALFRLAGEVAMGEPAKAIVRAGEAAAIATGGMLPEGANAVVMVENTEMPGADTLTVNRAAAPWENTIARGEDMAAGDVALPAGQIIRPQDMGVLAALGITKVDVRRKVRAAVLSTGDELVEPYVEPRPGQIRDINSHLLEGWVKACGAEAFRLGIVRDNADDLLSALQKTGDYDCVLLSGGSSAGTRDYAAACINALGAPGVLFHGVSMRPGKPLIYGAAGDKPFFGLSGNPTSAMVGFLLFVRPLLYQMSRARVSEFPIRARITKNLSSAGGREDYIRALLLDRDGELWAEPILGQSGLISTAVRGNALIRIPQNSEGLEAGARAEVLLI